MGWSSGGTIALEIAAILEKEGVKDVTVYLLDTILSDATIRRLSPKVDSSYLKELESKMKGFGYEDSYIKKVLSVCIPESLISHDVISKMLNDTNLILFKALKEDAKRDQWGLEKLTKYALSLKDNNVGIIVEN